MPALITVVVAAGLLVVLATMTGPTSAHASFTADNISVTSNAGQLIDLKMSPEGDVHYDGLESSPSRIEIAVQVQGSGGNWETIDSKSVSATGLEGQVDYSFAQIDVLDHSSLSPGDFRAGDGASTTTDIDVRTSVVLVGSGSGGSNVTTSATDVLTITITNQAAEARTGGTANASASAR
jgi:hypothetical protein